MSDSPEAAGPERFTSSSFTGSSTEVTLVFKGDERVVHCFIPSPVPTRLLISYAQSAVSSSEPPEPPMTDISDIATRLKDVERDLTEVRVSVGRIESTIPHLPTTAKLLTVAVAGLLAVVGAMWSGFLWLAEKFALAGALPAG